MKITVINERDSTTNVIQFNQILVKDLLQQLKINPETVLVIRNNEVITESHQLEDNDKLEILSVISGG
jgi:thiamine biosynthesis protein ThiS